MKQVIVIRKDLGCRRGKEIVQGAHASQMALVEAKRLLAPVDIDFWLDHWGMRKVCVRVDSEAELIEIYNQAKQAGLPCALVVDEGLTEFAGEMTRTAVGIGPASADEIDKITRNLKLY